MRRRLSIGDTYTGRESQGEFKFAAHVLPFLAGRWGRGLAHWTRQTARQAHLPVDVLFDVAGALADTEALQQRCG